MRVDVAGRAAGAIVLSAEWQVYELPVALDRAAVAGARAGAVVVRLETATFVPGYADQRRLGVMLDWAELAPRPQAGPNDERAAKYKARSTRKYDQ